MNREEALALALEIERYRDDLTVVDFTYDSPGVFGITIQLQDFPGATIMSREEWTRIVEALEARADIWGEFVVRRGQ